MFQKYVWQDLEQAIRIYKKCQHVHGKYKKWKKEKEKEEKGACIYSHHTNLKKTANGFLLRLKKTSKITMPCGHIHGLILYLSAI